MFIWIYVRNAEPSEKIDWNFSTTFMGKRYILRIDWSPRFDSMQQHNGQHLLTATILRCMVG